MDEAELDEQIRRSVKALVARASEPRPFPDRSDIIGAERDGQTTLHRPFGRRRAVSLAVAAAVVLLGGWGAWSAIAKPAPVDTIGEGLAVLHEIVSYEQSFDLTCPEGRPSVRGEFGSMVFESWGSQAQGRWRQVVRYPDGSERSLLATDSPWYPTDLYTAGEVKGQTVGCSDSDNLLSEPGQGGWFYLNPMSAPPTVPGSQESAVPSYSDLGELVDDAGVGPDGRTVELWRQVIDGTYSNASGSGTLQQVDEWLVDPATDQVVQRNFSQSYEGLGEIHWTARLDAFESATVDPNLFQPDGLTRQPDKSPDPTPTTVQEPVDSQEPQRPVAAGWIEVTDLPEVPEGSEPTAALHSDGLWQIALCRQVGGSAEATILWAEQIDQWIEAFTPGISACVRSIVKTPYGYFADATPFGYWSEDGKTWSQWTIPSTDDQQRSWAIEAWFHLEGSARVTLLASSPAPGESRTAHLLTTTDGATWGEGDRDSAQIFDNTDLAAVFEVDAGLVAVGSSPGGEATPTAAAFSSPDGVVWTRTTPASRDFEDKAITDVIETENGYLAVGGDFFNNGLMASWGSPDGRIWTPGPQPTENVNPSIGQVTAYDVSATAQGFIAAGLDYDASRSPNQLPAFWLSSDGRTWTRSDDPLTGPIVPFTFLADTQGDLAAWPPKGAGINDPFRLFTPAP